MSYYSFHKKKILKDAKNNYHNKGCTKWLLSIILETEKF